ncbi:hypothetical protein [Legionella drancourtii]|uniref:Uncharacterized protein n=1 Tax=Legionella drancourtii LLAP12 TaxID=658187 RepID=G9EPM3_9GAMM|nr:hypothetical protein [Legionella drancourtii]EHL30796.1 hypothetical protein LDG_7225 [Legionella drancourtii LLAP12]
MPILFKLSKVTISVKDSSEAKKLILLVDNPKTSKLDYSIDKIVHIDTGESLFLGSSDTRYFYTASTGTSSCLQSYFYNANNERCLIHFNADFSVNWAEIFHNFSNKKINFCLIGATAIPGQLKSARNIDCFFDSLFNYVNNHDIELTLTHQQVLSHNKNDLMRLFSPATPIAKLANIAFDAEGNVYDVTAIRMSLMDFPLAQNLRNTRKHEGEHRAWLSRQLHYEQETPKPEILIIKSSSNFSDVAQNTVFHKLVIDFVAHLAKTNTIRTYCEYMTRMLYKVNSPSDKPDAAQYFASLESFFSSILVFAQDVLKEIQVMLAQHPEGPFNPVVFSYKQDYSNQMASLMDAMPFNEVSAKQQNPPTLL